jgi:hypothetical protein
VRRGRQRPGPGRRSGDGWVILGMAVLATGGGLGLLAFVGRSLHAG